MLRVYTTALLIENGKGHLIHTCCAVFMAKNWCWPSPPHI